MTTRPGQIHTLGALPQLRAYAGHVGELVWLAGNGEGLFVWESAERKDDGGTFINKAGLGATAAGWSRVYSGRLQAEWFGARGDCLEGVGDTVSGSPVVHVDTFSFSNADIGKLFAVDFAGAGGKSLVGTILSVNGQNITLDVAATSTQSNKFCRWGTNDAPALRRWLKSVNDQMRGAVPYNTREAYLLGGKSYMVHSVGRACLDLNGFTRLASDHRATLVAASDDDIIINTAGQYNDISGLQFKHGRHAIQLFGRAQTYGDAYIGSPANTQSVFNLAQVSFYYQRGPSIWQDRSGPGSNRVNSGRINLRDFEFIGNTLSMVESDGFTVSDGWLIVDSSTYPVLWDDGRPMAAMVVGDVVSVMNVSAAPIYASSAAWFEGWGNISTQGFRAGGENGRPCFCLRTEGMIYNGQELLEEDHANTILTTDSDAWASTSTKHFIEIEDAFPTLISIKRVQPFPVPVPGVTVRDYIPFGNPDCTIWVDSDSIELSDIYGQNSQGLQLDIDVTVPYRFVYSDNRASQHGQDISHYLSTYMQRGNAPESSAPAFNHWWTSGSGGFVFDVSWGAGGVFNSLSATNISMFTKTVRKWTSNRANNTANAAMPLNNTGGVKWGAGIDAGCYTLSVYVLADYAGFMSFAHDSSQGSGQPRKFEPSTLPQRLSWSFWHNGNAEKTLQLNVSSIPGTLGAPGSFAAGLPMINAGPSAAPYLPPGETPPELWQWS